MISSMFFEPIIPRGHLQVCLLNSRHADSKIFCFSRVIHPLSKTRKGQIHFSNYTRSPPPKKKPQTLSCLQQLLDKSLSSMGWMRTCASYKGDQYPSSSSSPWGSLSFPSFSPFPHLSSTEGVAQDSSQTWTSQTRLIKSRNKEII